MSGLVIVIMCVYVMLTLTVSVTYHSKLDATGDTYVDDEDFLIRRLRSAPRVKRIIGGSSVNNGQWPWLVNLRGQIPATSWGWIVTSYSNYYCGGSLISKRWVLTAAHCFSVPGAPSGIGTASNWHIKAGDVKRTVTGLLDQLKQLWTRITDQPTADWWYVHASKVIIHPQYNANDRWMNDIALVKLDRDLPLAPSDPFIDIVTLPTSIPADWPPTGLNCSMQGWGCSAEGGPLQLYAQAVTLPIVSSVTCSQVFGDIGSTRVCAGFNVGAKGICKGDSGGPLVCRDGLNWKQAGLASFASGDNSGNWPGVFTRVSQYTTWISGVLAAN